MNKNKIVNIIEKWKKPFDFTGGVGDNRIKEIEEILTVNLPNSYKWFLKEYGYGGIMGVEILGAGKAETPNCVRETLDFREYGLPEFMVVIENCNEWVYCLGTKDTKNGECLVVDWSLDYGIGSERFNNFYEFLLDRFTYAIEDFE